MNWSSTLALLGQAAEPAAEAQKTESPFGGGLVPLLLIIFGLFYFMILRPQKKGQQKVEEMRDTVKKGDRVKTIGGIHGTVTAVDTTNNIVSVQVDGKVKLDFDKSAIATVIRKEDAKQAKGVKATETSDDEPSK